MAIFTEIPSIAAGALTDLLAGRPRNEGVSEYFYTVEEAYPAFIDSVVENLGNILLQMLRRRESRATFVRKEASVATIK